MKRALRIRTKIRKHGSEETEIVEQFVVVTDEEDIELLVQMSYGSFHDIIEFQTENVDIFVSEAYCNSVVIKNLQNKKHLIRR